MARRLMTKIDAGKAIVNRADKATGPAAQSLTTAAEQSSKLRQSDAEYSNTRRNIQLHKGCARMYVCLRCQANFTAGGGVPTNKMAGMGKCNACLVARR